MAVWCGSPLQSKGGTSFIDLLASPTGSHPTGDGSLRFMTRTTTTRTVVRTTKETTIVTTVLRISPPGKPAAAQPALAFSASSASTAQHARLGAFLAHVELWRAAHASSDFASEKCALACAADWVRAESARGGARGANSESEAESSSVDELDGTLDGGLGGALDSVYLGEEEDDDEVGDGDDEDQNEDDDEREDDNADGDGQSSDDHSPMLRWVDPATGGSLSRYGATRGRVAHLCAQLPPSPSAAFDAARSSAAASVLALSPRQRAVQRLSVSAREAWRCGRSCLGASVFGASVRDADKLRCCVCSYVIVVGAVAAESYAFVCGACQQQLQPAALSPRAMM